MNVFLKKLVVYILLFAGFAAGACIITSWLAHPYMMRKGRGSVIDKNRRLAYLPSPKIILVGGSNVCYGINSQLLQNSLHLPVVDMAINADVGMLFYYNQVKPFIHKGDIIIGIPEWSAGNKIYGDESMYELGIADTKNLATLTTLQWLRLPIFMGTIIKDNYTIIFSDKGARVNNGRTLYNAFGDYEGHKADTLTLGSLQDTAAVAAKSNLPVPAEYSSLVKDFAAYCRQQGATYLQGFPVGARAQYDKGYASAVIAKLSGIHFIGTPEEYLYNYNQLYDSPNHLIFSMRDERTRKLVEDVREGLAIQ